MRQNDFAKEAIAMMNAKLDVERQAQIVRRNPAMVLIKVPVTTHRDAVEQFAKDNPDCVVEKIPDYRVIVSNDPTTIGLAFLMFTDAERWGGSL